VSRLHFCLLVLISLTMPCTACSKQPREKLVETIDPAEAMKDPDFPVQGEYLGDGIWSGAENTKAGAQVVALGGGKFTVVVTKGGLPGNGWKRDDPRFSLEGTHQEHKVTLSGKGFSGAIDGEAMTVTGDDGKTKLRLIRTVRGSPTEGQKPPKGAVVLFDGTTPEHFEHGTMSPDGNLMSEVTTKQKFTDYTLHLEFRLSYMPTARGQERSNSGVYLHDCYEIQVLDSFGLEGEDNECGGFYRLRRPDVNMCYPPLTWQTYDVEFAAPKYKDGEKTANARVTVTHNGVVIHPEFELARNTPGRQDEGPAPRPIYLQGHGNKVEFRNIWVMEKK
jgi:hypothetical protein